MLNRVNIPTTGFTLNTWTTLDISGYVTAGTRAVLMLITSSGFTAGVRAVDCTTELKNVVRQYGPQFRLVPLKESGAELQLQYYLAHASVTFDILAEFSSSTGFETGDLTDLFNTTTGAYQSASPAGIPADAELAVLNINNSSAESYQLSLQETGDPYYYWYLTQLGLGLAPVTSGSFQYKQSSANLAGYYQGYIPNATQCSRTPYQLSTTGWNTITAGSEIPNGASIAIVNMRQVADAQFYIRAVGSTDTALTNTCLKAGHQIWWLVDLNVSKQFEVYTSDATPGNVTVDIIGYVANSPLEIAVVDPVQFVMSIGIVDQRLVALGSRYSIEMEIEI